MYLRNKMDFSLYLNISVIKERLTNIIADMHIAARLHNLIFYKSPGGSNYFFLHIQNRGVFKRCIAKVNILGQVSPCVISQ